MVLSSYPLQPALYFKWVTLAEWIGIYRYCHYIHLIKTYLYPNGIKIIKGISSLN